jgi:hypothetical protein
VRQVLKNDAVLPTVCDKQGQSMQVRVDLVGTGPILSPDQIGGGQHIAKFISNLESKVDGETTGSASGAEGEQPGKPGPLLPGPSVEDEIVLESGGDGYLTTHTYLVAQDH